MDRHSVQAWNRTTTIEAAAAHLLPGRSLFAQRLLRQSRVESDLHHAAGGGRGVQNNSGKTVTRVGGRTQGYEALSCSAV